MFSKAEKQHIAEVVEKALRDLHHPEMQDEGEPVHFMLHVDGREAWSFADIRENRADDAPGNPWNEIAREVLK